eukprot:CAMPEP_0179063356 /NCGR_PEP_ID=MMETSP0796-20121207/27393_1 /TAXON_ID=73915 /ORGANISM="Pyrodinium bahamense, Strain pbaha01" /LENGTH=47 /DNA_ID= /DNA_START= /DNA_END= /DNA_ORIENTATION=
MCPGSCREVRCCTVLEDPSCVQGPAGPPVQISCTRQRMSQLTASMLR